MSRALLLAGTILTALLFSVVTASLFRLDQVPGVLALTLTGLRSTPPSARTSALVLVAAVVPITTYLLGRWAYGVAWPEAVVIAFAAGWAWRRVLRRSEPPLPREPAPAGARLCLRADHIAARADDGRCLASWRRRIHDLHPATRLARILRHWRWTLSPGGRAPARRPVPVLRLGSRGCCRWPSRTAACRCAGRVDGAGGGGQPAANRQERAAVSGFLARARSRGLVKARFNVQSADVNAAGSAFALLLLVAGGLAAARGRFWRFWTGAAALLALGLWMSGSRTALLACPVALAALGLVAARTHMSRRGRTAVGRGRRGCSAPPLPSSTRRHAEPESVSRSPRRCAWRWRERR